MFSDSLCENRAALVSTKLSRPFQITHIGINRAYGQSFHTSIWHVAMSGITDPSYVEGIRLKFGEVCRVLISRTSHTPNDSL